MSDIAALIDHTLLRPEAVPADVELLCREAIENGFATVIVHLAYLGLAVELTAGSSVKAGTVVDFCFGASPVNIKTFEAEAAVRGGAEELDMILNLGLLKAGDHRRAEAEIAAVVDHSRAAYRESGRAGAPIVKVIIEAGLLSDGEKETACRLVKSAGADFVKTSTGFFGSGATASDVALMRRVVGPDFGVKASGGIRTLAQAREMIAAGADRIGTSSGMAIIAELKGEDRDKI